MVSGCPYAWSIEHVSEIHGMYYDLFPELNNAECVLNQNERELHVITKDSVLIIDSYGLL
jgi:phosphatidylserine decarboxylase